ncbi:MAG: CoA pyrophosphatase [Halodesulfurarchaeum sp.]
MDLGPVASHEPCSIREGERDASVLVPVVERQSGPCLLFIRRADHLGVHPGQMGFPGGGKEPGDRTLRRTAIREAFEEIGLEAAEIEFVGRLDDTRTTSGYTITPFVSRIPDRTYRPDQREVAEVVVLPVAELTDLSNYDRRRRDHPLFGESTLHFFTVDDYTVWGATGRILVQFLELTTEWHPPEMSEAVLDRETDPVT